MHFYEAYHTASLVNNTVIGAKGITGTYNEDTLDLVTYKGISNHEDGVYMPRLIHLTKTNLNTMTIDTFTVRDSVIRSNEINYNGFIIDVGRDDSNVPYIGALTITNFVAEDVY
jgi:hypothetical protein